jgi:hypothetical protein
MSESDLLVADEEVVAHHDTHERREEDGEGAQYRDKRGGFVDELPWLDDPGGSKGNYSTSANVNVARKDAS